MKKRLQVSKTVLKDWYQNNFAWRHIRHAKLVHEIGLKEWGGCQLFVQDINNDGIPEFLWLQSLGIYKSRIFLGKNSTIDYYLSAHGQDVFCLTATDQSGKILWQVGSPYSGPIPYLSHATEHMVTVADVDADGVAEVLTFNGTGELWMLDGRSGEKRKAIQLPMDNFVTVKSGIRIPSTGERVILVGASDISYPPYDYANPWIFLSSSFDLICIREFIGAGHQMAILDADGDLQDEFLVGYQLIDTNGDVLWTVDEWIGKTIKAREQHVDHLEVCWINDEWYAAIAGSDRQYWVDSTGKTLWSHRLPHPQYCLIGRSGDQPEIFVFNQRVSMNCYDLRGKGLWKGLLPENWPQGRPPGAFHSRPIHNNKPAISVEINSDKSKNQFVYTESGWPYVADYYGNPTLLLPFGNQYKQPKTSSPARRINDVGLAYNAEVYDLDGDGRSEIIVYNREHAWIFEIE